MPLAIDRLKALVPLIREQDIPPSMGHGVSALEVQRCEERLGVRLPDSYKCFLQEFDVGYWPDYIYGLASSLPPGLHIVQATEDARQNGNPKLPHHLVPFSPDGWGNLYCLDTSQMQEGECPVVFWNHDLDEDQQPQQTHRTFVDWLEEMIRWQQELDAEDNAP